MFNLHFLERVRVWRDFRSELETSVDPLNDCISFWNRAPIGRISADPYDRETWPDPWELLKENTYCEFTKILAIYYTLQLTERFSESAYEIHIVLDAKESAMHYLLLVDNQAIGYYYDSCIDANELPVLQSQLQYSDLPSYI